ncbi:MAG TPA: hypothetical protein VGD56_06370, partial [Gemmatirosa sp.]
ARACWASCAIAASYADALAREGARAFRRQAALVALPSAGPNAHICTLHCVAGAPARALRAGSTRALQE